MSPCASQSFNTLSQKPGELSLNGKALMKKKLWSSSNIK